MSRFRTDLLNAGEPSDTSVPRKENMMCLNESTMDPYQSIDEALNQYLQHLPLNRYFNNVTSELKKELLGYVGHNVKSDGLLWGNGADDILYTVFLAAREHNDSYALTLAPSYFDYPTFCRAVGLGTKFIDFTPDFDFDEKAYVEEANKPDCTLAILCNPNNPTGHLLPEEKIRYIIEHTDKPVLLDETYFEFSGATLAADLEKYPHLLIVRSFSKAFSAAGLRFGYLLSQPENIREVRKAQTIFNTSLLVQAFALTILLNRPVFMAHTRKAIDLKNRLYQTMNSIEQIKVHQSHTNFLTFTIGEKSLELFEHLKNNEIAIRNVGAHAILKNHLRVTTGTAAQNELFIDRVKEFLAK